MITTPEFRMHPTSSASVPREPWYKYGVAILCLEMLIAVAVSAYSLYVTYHGVGLPGGRLPG